MLEALHFMTPSPDTKKIVVELFGVFKNVAGGEQRR